MVVGHGDQSKANFEHVLAKARNISHKWSSRNLSIPAQVLVVKTFIFSMFIHVCNCTFLHPDQLELLQKILNQFIWKGKNCISPRVMYAPVIHGGINMINVKNVVHSLMVKWMCCLLLDRGTSWSLHAWNKLTTVIPERLFTGLTAVDENDLKMLSPFY